MTTINYSNGSKSTVETIEAVHAEIIATYPDAVYCHNGEADDVPRDSEIDDAGRILVWEDEEHSENDDGARAVASIYRAVAKA